MTPRLVSIRASSSIWQDMLSKADKRIEEWCASLCIRVDNLTEEQMMQIVNEGVKKVRRMKNGVKWQTETQFTNPWENQLDLKEGF